MVQIMTHAGHKERQNLYISTLKTEFSALISLCDQCVCVILVFVFLLEVVGQLQVLVEQVAEV